MRMKELLMMKSDEEIEARARYKMPRLPDSQA
jgi:hypothetical protein